MLPRLSLRTRPLRRIIILSASLLILGFLYRAGSIGHAFGDVSLYGNTTALSTSSGHDLKNKTEAGISKKPQHHDNEVKKPQLKPEIEISQHSEHHDDKIENQQAQSEQDVSQPAQSHISESVTQNTPSHPDFEYNHTEIFSVSSKDKAYLRIDFSGKGANDPSLIPHPVLKDTWIILAQGTDTPEKEGEGPYDYICNAMLNEQGIIHCTTPSILPVRLPISPRNCSTGPGSLKISGGRNSRIFYGPDTPFLTYEIHAESSCPRQNTTKHDRQYIQDLRTLVYLGAKPAASDAFARSTQLDTLAAPGSGASNRWFLFWDMKNQTYAHYGLSPKRIYGKVDPLSSKVANTSMQLPASDAKCILKYMPPTGIADIIAPATNSLSITTCKRFDAGCHMTAANTFVMAIFQHRIKRRETSMLEPYVIIFDREAPFAMHGISKRPLWIAGRAGKEDKSQMEMVNIMSMSWKDSTQRYHGYADDIVHVSFGIQGRSTAVIDVEAGDLLQDLGRCSEP